MRRREVGRQLRVGLWAVGFVAAAACGGRSISGRDGDGSWGASGGEGDIADGGVGARANGGVTVGGATGGVSLGGATGGGTSTPGRGGVGGTERGGGGTERGGSGSLGTGSTAPVPGDDGSSVGGSGGSGGTGESPFGGFGGTAAVGASVGVGGARISLGGSGGAGGAGAMGAMGAYAGASGGANIVDSCARLCEGNQTGCGAVRNLRPCLDECARLAVEMPQCASEIENYVDCVAPVRALAGACCLTANCAERQEVECAQAMHAFGLCAQLCEGSETAADDFSCIYQQRCRGGDYQTLCSRFDSSSQTWACNCFVGLSWQSGQNVTAAPGESPCQLAACGPM